MATFAIDLISGKEFIFVPPLGSGTGSTGSTGSFVEKSVFSGYTATTELRFLAIENNIIYLSGITDTKLNIVDFTGYTATTNVTINNIENDITYISGVTDTKLNVNIFTGYTANTVNLSSILFENEVLGLANGELTGFTAQYIESLLSIITFSDTAPSFPHTQKFWVDTTTMTLYFQYNDGDSTQWVGGSTTPNSTTKRVELTITDGATPTIDCQNGTEVYAKWEAGTAATAPVLNNLLVNSVIHLSIIKTIAGDITVTFSKTGYQFALESETAGASKAVTLTGDQNAFFSVILTVTAHEISGDKVVTIATS